MALCLQACLSSSGASMLTQLAEACSTCLVYQSTALESLPYASASYIWRKVPPASISRCMLLNIEKLAGKQMLKRPDGQHT